MAGAVVRRRMLPLFGWTAGVKLATAATVDLALTCDTTLGRVLRTVSAAYATRTSVRVFVFPTGPGLILPQLERDIQNDILVTRVPTLEEATQQSLVASASDMRWRNPLVIAGSSRASALDQTIAVTDPNPASVVDGHYVLAQLGLKPRRVLGAVDGDEVAFLISNGMAQAGLMHMTDVRANGLDVIRPVPADIWPPEVYGACITRLARRPNPQGFVAFLTADSQRLLADGGLEVQA